MATGIECAMATYGPTFRIAAAILLGIAMAGCNPQHKQEPLPKLRLTGPQLEALRLMNEAGTAIYQGRTWRFEFGGACVLRVMRSYDNRVEGSADLGLTGQQIEVIEYASQGYGVKAYGTGRQGGSVDLFDSSSDVKAKAFAMQVSQLSAACVPKPSASSNP
jgi:hypothetical protein